MDAEDKLCVEAGTAPSTTGLTPTDELQPWVESPVPSFQLLERGNRLLGWRDGVYRIVSNDNREQSVAIGGCEVSPIVGRWKLSFPPGWDTPDSVELQRLEPWSALADSASRAFSGSAIYSCEFSLNTVEPDARLLLDLGRLSAIGEVNINGKSVATMWAPPFRTDITPYVRTGTNQLDVTVTNTWYNRLIYDAGLPEKERKTWTIRGPGADDDLELSGLIGPVDIRKRRVVELPEPSSGASANK